MIMFTTYFIIRSEICYRLRLFLVSFVPLPHHLLHRFNQIRTVHSLLLKPTKSLITIEIKFKSKNYLSFSQLRILTVPCSVSFSKITCDTLSSIHCSWISSKLFASKNPHLNPADHSSFKIYKTNFQQKRSLKIKVSSL